jgi:hypothetical protein
MKFRLHLHPVWITVLFALTLTLSTCSPQSAPTPFVAPTEPNQITIITATPALAIATSIPTIIIPTPTPPCTDGLTYVSDLTIPDNTVVTPSQSIDKQWLVTNSGGCDWDSRYRLKLINGSNLGAPTEQALYPARPWTQAILQIMLTAPNDTGTYRSAWQAFSPDGTAFGDAVYIQIIVQ